MARRAGSGLRRRPSSRAPKQRFILFCEGAKTEPAYFRALRRLCPQTLIDVETVTAVGVPYTVAQKAAERAKALGLARKSRKGLNSYEEKDEVWAVFDRDEHPDFNKALECCSSHNVGIARSNPCFEVWLVLHILDHHKPDSRHKVQELLAKHCPDYNPKKGKTPNCEALLAAIEQAEKRADAQLKQRAAEGSPYGNPSTTVFRLTRTIRLAAGLVKA